MIGLCLFSLTNNGVLQVAYVLARTKRVRGLLDTLHTRAHAHLSAVCYKTQATAFINTRSVRTGQKPS
jgi:hypothetical protein